jgi:tetratricopeptide (TPR) repeat protein
LDRVEEAVADVTAAIDLQPDDIDILAQAYVNRSIALSTLERTDDAVADLRMVLDLVPPTHELNRQALALLA